MLPSFLRGLLLSSGVYLLFSTSLQAQQAAVRVLVVSPLVGETIDQQEKRYYGLFPYFSTADFDQARFEQSLSPDSTITLQVRFLSGTSRSRVFTPAQFAQVRQSIELRQQELAGAGTSSTGALQYGRSYAVQTADGTSFVGVLVTERPQELDFDVKILGPRTVPRADIRQLELLTPEQARRGWDPVGNGTRVFGMPTARPLRRGETLVQAAGLLNVAASHGFSDRLSAGGVLELPVGPGSRSYVSLTLTGKYAVPVAEKFHVGMYGEVTRAYGLLFGAVYGLGTYGTADHNLTAGVGYGYGYGRFGSTPVVVLGGATRILRRLSLLNETYIYETNVFGVKQRHLLGLFGARVAASRLSGTLGLAYSDGSATAPAYLEVAYRFGQVK
ncbi:hypothetical protein [Hymenobacter chitinivorans]|uniref:Uncharacterized protein n=1 Tax=Hymenobacter chitinivorans DSM 11115 TaxID=1121954 RepID=A0A2M9B5A4_9BACT|nr:hypothetical protein [Hymenobacter chitinivorans]PJJ53114.1 hypothetical protein CLV45_3772 [Hymenobacter chitinivorans DSM 11115]